MYDGQMWLKNCLCPPSSKWVYLIWKNWRRLGSERRGDGHHHSYAEPKIQWIANNHCPYGQQATGPLPLPLPTLENVVCSLSHRWHPCVFTKRNAAFSCRYYMNRFRSYELRNLHVREHTYFLGTKWNKKSSRTSWFDVILIGSVDNNKSTFLFLID